MYKYIVKTIRKIYIIYLQILNKSIKTEEFSQPTVSEYFRSYFIHVF